ncbi:hypothetical protein ABQF35_26765 [Mycobacterium syngnathidarum]
MLKLPHRVRLRVDEYLPDVLTGLSAGAFCGASIGPSYHWSGKAVIALVATGILCAAGSIIYNRRRHRPTLHALTSENTTLKNKVTYCEAQIDDRVANLVDVVKVLLRDLASDLDIYKGDTRLSVYRHSGSQFYLVGRVSPNESYAAIGRKAYPDTQGFIGEVWRQADDKTYVSFPTDRQDWLDTQVESFGFSLEEAEALKMQTVAMMATKLRRDTHGEAFGVLCVECDKKRATVKAATIDAVRQSSHFQTLTSVLDISLAGLTHEEVKRGFLDRDVTH